MTINGANNLAISPNAKVLLVTSSALARLTFNPAPQGGAGGGRGASGPPADPPGAAGRARSIGASRAWCDDEAAEHPDAYVVCVDAYDAVDGAGVPTPRDVISPVGAPTPWGTLALNRWVYLVIRTRGSQQVTYDLSGTRGLSSGEFLIATSSSAGRQVSGDDATDAHYVRRPYGPRLPGSIELRVALGSDITHNPLVIDFEVVRSYIGAIRLGASVVFDPATQRTYSVAPAGGSSQPVVSLHSSNPADFEAVFTATAFVPDLLSSYRGRQYSFPRPWYSIIIPSPMFGVGVVSAGADGVSAFRSIYLGGEWEFVRGFSVAVALAMRRVNRLADGYALGQAVGANVTDATVTAERIDFGPAIILGFSPEFLQFASPVPTGRSGRE